MEKQNNDPSFFNHQYDQYVQHIANTNENQAYEKPLQVSASRPNDDRDRDEDSATTGSFPQP
jgi:hypothetical protein